MKCVGCAKCKVVYRDVSESEVSLHIEEIPEGCRIQKMFVKCDLGVFQECNVSAYHIGASDCAHWENACESEEDYQKLLASLRTSHWFRKEHIKIKIK